MDDKPSRNCDSGAARWLTLREASALSGRSRSALKSALHQGRLRAVKRRQAQSGPERWYTTPQWLAQMRAPTLPHSRSAWDERTCGRCAGQPCRDSAPPRGADADQIAWWLLEHEVIAVDALACTVCDLRTGRVQALPPGRDVLDFDVTIRLDANRPETFMFSRAAALASLGAAALRGRDILVFEPGHPPHVVLALGRHGSAGRARRKPAVERCACCGDPGGYSNPRTLNLSPVRYKGERFGFGEGCLCKRCYERYRHTERTGRAYLNRTERGFTGGMTLTNQ